MKGILFFGFILLTQLNCATSGSPGYSESKVIERIGGREATPEWTFGETPMSIENGDVVFVNIVSMSGNSRAESCLKSAELDGRSKFLRYIQENITTSGQLNEISATDDPAYESLTAFLSQGKLSGAKTTARYWEKREESDESGARVLRLKCAVKVALKKSELEKQMRAATGNGGNKEIRDQLINAQKVFIESISEGSSKE